MSDESRVFVHRKPGVHIRTFGCQMNACDSAIMAGVMQEAGYERVDSAEEADVVLLNTCSVRQHAEERVFGVIGALKEVKNRRPGLIIGVCGCMAQRHGSGIRARASHVDIVCGTDRMGRIAELVERAREGAVVDTGSSGEMPPSPTMPVANPGRGEGYGVTSFVSIMRGCNNRCAYCIVPSLRGPERSRPAGEVVVEVEQLARAGVREITLLGQNVASYGREGPVRLAGLLPMVAVVEGIKRVRFLTSYPSDVGRELLDAIAGIEEVCEYIHLPVQAGSDRMLKAMGRRYTRDEYLRLVDETRTAVPEVAISTDVIVGFPGETGADFDETVSLVEKVRFDSGYMFKYSEREGTRAADLADDVPAAVKQSRLVQLIEMQRQISLERNSSLVGRMVEVLVEGPSEKDRDMVSGRTRDHRMVVLPGGDDMIGSLVDVRVAEAGPWTLIGEPAERKELVP